MQKGRIDNKLSSYYWILHTIYKTGEPLVSTSWPNKKNLYYNDSILYLNTISWNIYMYIILSLSSLQFLSDIVKSSKLW